MVVAVMWKSYLDLATELSYWQ